MAKIKELRGIIYSLFDSEADLARSLGWTKQRINKITNGVKVPDLQEVQALSHALNRPLEEIANIFLHI